MRSALLPRELTVLANRLARIARADRRTRDFTLQHAAPGARRDRRLFPGLPHLHRRSDVSAQDRRYIEWAVRAGAPAQPRRRRERVRLHPRRAAAASRPRRASGASADDYRAFAMRFQQFTAPVTAKGVEDTAFYVYNRLVSLNEVGGDPGAIRHPTSEGLPSRQRRAPRAMAAIRCWPPRLTTTSAPRTCVREST